VAESELRFLKARDCSNDYDQTKVIIQHELGWCKILQNDFETSRALFEDFLANTKSENQKTWCYYQLGLCYLCLGQNEKAMECFAKVKQFKKSQHGFDDYATRKAVDFMAKGGASLEEIILQKAMHSKRCNNIVEANKYLKEFDEECSSTANPDMAAWAHYLKGKVARYEKKLRSSENPLPTCYRCTKDDQKGEVYCAPL